ncbi:MAG: hypothetical protein ABIS26_00270, partial [Candidatus Paceibacterota bacterium]
MTYSFLSRSRILLIFIILFSFVLLGRLFLVQVVHGDAYSESANRQYVTPTNNIFERGTIFFQTKEGNLISAATQTSGYKVAIDPSKIKNTEDLYQKLNKVSPVSKEDFISRAKKTPDTYEEILH